ncbi:hypothetical protein JTB14_031536 [Gonioctena quinquepunctata]|nr:hypothetical protein JTB14_031536 [Gonioctena quinquepunctata]
MNYRHNSEWIGTILLAGLPESYKPMIMGIECLGVQITADSVKTKLLQDIPVVTGSDQYSVAMFGASSSKFKGSRELSQYVKRLGRKNSDVAMNDIYFFPQLKVKLLSVSQIVSEGHTVAFESDGAKRNIVNVTRDVQFVENEKGSTLLEKKKGDTVEEKDLCCFPEQELTAQTRSDFDKTDLEERYEMDISEPENGSSDGYVDVISDVDVNKNDSNFLPGIEQREENASPVQINQRVRRAPGVMKDYLTYSAMVEVVEKALSRPDKDKWFQAMQNEYDTLNQNAIWDLVDLPPENRPLNFEGVFKTEGYIRDMPQFEAGLVI